MPLPHGLAAVGGAAPGKPTRRQIMLKGMHPVFAGKESTDKDGAPMKPVPDSERQPKGK